MRHLKSRKDQIIQNGWDLANQTIDLIKDICLEISDEGFETDINFFNQGGSSSPPPVQGETDFFPKSGYIQVFNSGKQLNLKDVAEVLYRLRDAGVNITVIRVRQLPFNSLSTPKFNISESLLLTAFKDNRLNVYYERLGDLLDVVILFNI